MKSVDTSIVDSSITLTVTGNVPPESVFFWNVYVPGGMLKWFMFAGASGATGVDGVVLGGVAGVGVDGSVDGSVLGSDGSVDDSHLGLEYLSNTHFLPSSHSGLHTGTRLHPEPSKLFSQQKPVASPSGVSNLYKVTSFSAVQF